MKKGRALWVVVAVVAAVALVGCLVWFLLTNRRTQPTDQFIEHTPEPSPTVEASVEPSPQPEENPVDWEALWEINTDIYAYIEVPQAGISEPVVQNSSDDSYYLRRDYYGNYSLAGSIFTEATYNTTTFDDPVTLIYGHNMLDDTVFSPLEDYGQTTEMGQEDIVVIYQPERKLIYQIFAAVPHDRSHILYYNNFELEGDYTSFFQGILETRDLIANVREELFPEYGDKVVILSTCLGASGVQRYLVMGKLVEEVPLVPPES